MGEKWAERRPTKKMFVKYQHISPSTHTHTHNHVPKVALSQSSIGKHGHIRSVNLSKLVW